MTSSFNLTGFGASNVTGFGGATSAKTTPKGPGAFDATAAATVGVQFAGNIASQIFSFQAAQAETERANAVAQIDYWTKWQAQSEENYRNYELQLNQWYRQSDYVERMRQYESKLAEQRSIYKGEVSTSATNNFARQLAELEGRFYEDEAKDLIDLENTRLQSIASAAKVSAGGQVGRTAMALQNSKNQQYLSNLSNRQITRNYRIADKLRAAEVADIQRQNLINQVADYTPQPIQDPIQPLAPLPVRGFEPTPAYAPSGSALAMNITKTGYDAVKQYQSMLPPKPGTEEETKIGQRYLRQVLGVSE